MADQFLGEIRIFAGNFAPKSWAFCDGALLPLSQNTALFSLLGTTYGGDGESTFALPDLRGRTPVGPGQGPGLSQVDLGETFGAETVTLGVPEVPAHAHGVRGSTADGSTGNPSGAVWAVSRQGRATERLYATGAAAPMSATAVAPQGGGQAHNNLAPYLVVTFIIALQGIYPPRT
jgi:microcystin-dependent protein